MFKTKVATAIVAIGVGAVGAAAPALAAPVTAPAPQAPVLVAPAPQAPIGPMPTGWLGDTGQFALCLGGFGVAAAPVVAGFMFGGPGGAAKAAKEWFPRLGPAGSSTLKNCMWSVLHVRV